MPTTCRTRSSAPRLDQPPEEDLGAATGHYLGVLANPSLAWEDLERLRELTSLPILVKGIQHADDAREAARRGVDGIVVSNHGGRQVDGAIGSLDALESIAAALGDSDLTILFDSGIRTGSDVIKALALGADAILLGRPYLWGLALEGQGGVETVLKMILAELELTHGSLRLRSPRADRPRCPCLSPRRGAPHSAALHERGCFVMPNPWDRGSAQALAGLGFPALATTSAGFAFSRGLPDSPTSLWARAGPRSRR